MQKEVFINSMMETYTKSTLITTLYIDALNIIPPVFSKGLDLTSMIEYMDFSEIISYLTLTFKQAGTRSICPNTFHTLYTHNFFVYNIVFINENKSLFGAVVSGPILVNSPDERFVDNILAEKNFSPHKKSMLSDLLKKLPSVSEERINYLGRLLFTSCKSGAENPFSPIQKIYRKVKSDIKPAFCGLMNDSLPEKENDRYLISSYEFCLNIRNNIMHGNAKGIKELFHTYSHLIWDGKFSSGNYRSLKNKCIIFSTISCIYSIQGNAPYKRVISVLNKFVSQLDELDSPDKMLNQLIIIIETYAHAVSAHADNHYSLHVNRTMQYIKNHFTEKITLDQLAAYVQLNPIYVSSLIKKETGLSLLENINKIRIEESKNLLSYTNRSVQEIAYAVGYNYQNHFNSIFKRYVGMTPLKYRQLNINNNYIPGLEIK